MASLWPQDRSVSQSQGLALVICQVIKQGLFVQLPVEGWRWGVKLGMACMIVNLATVNSAKGHTVQVQWVITYWVWSAIVQTCYSRVYAVVQTCHSSVCTIVQTCYSSVCAVVQTCHSSVCTIVQTCYSSVCTIAQTCYSSVCTIVHTCYSSVCTVVQTCYSSVCAL